VKAERWFVLVGGINGAGKTTLAQSRSFLQIFGVDPDRGQAVSAKKIRKRWPRSLANAPWFWAHADHAIVVFNGLSPGARPLLMAWKKDDEAWFLEGAPGPRLIADLKAARGGHLRTSK
jgi:predicted ABC-type ATPase